MEFPFVNIYLTLALFSIYINTNVVINASIDIIVVCVDQFPTIAIIKGKQSQARS